jgi:hypothetical protein
MPGLARPPALNDEHAGKVGGGLDEGLELEPGVQHGVQVGRQHPVVSTDIHLAALGSEQPSGTARTEIANRSQRIWGDAAAARDRLAREQWLPLRRERTTKRTHLAAKRLALPVMDRQVQACDPHQGYGSPSCRVSGRVA